MEKISNENFGLLCRSDEEPNLLSVSLEHSPFEIPSENVTGDRWMADAVQERNILVIGMIRGIFYSCLLRLDMFLFCLLFFFSFVGVTGSGKSALVQHLIHKKLDDMPATFTVSNKSVTGEVKYYPALWKRRVNDKLYQFNFYDTIGVGAADKEIGSIMTALRAKIKVVTGMHKVVICIRLERDRPAAILDLGKVITSLRALGFTEKHFLLAVTHCDPWDSSVVDKFVSESVALYGLDFLQPEQIARVCFADSRNVKPSLKEPFRLMVQESVDEVTQLLVVNDEEPPICVSGAVIEELEGQLKYGVLGTLAVSAMAMGMGLIIGLSRK
jgi:hypothetical protein